MEGARDLTVLVTGATDGLGLGVARELVLGGANVLVHGRNPQKLERVLIGIPDGAGTGPHGYLADLSCLEEVRRLGRDIARGHDRLDVIVNNAGVATGERKVSREGYELALAVNHLAHFRLTLDLLPMLGASPSPRIVNVSSLGQAPLDFGDLMLEREWDATRSYCQSKLAQILFAFELHERLGAGDLGVSARPAVNALHPSTYMDTNMVRRMGNRPISKVADGVRATIRLAVNEEMEGVSGRFFDVLEEARAHPQAYDPEARAALWEASEELTMTA